VHFAWDVASACRSRSANNYTNSCINSNLPCWVEVWWNSWAMQSEPTSTICANSWNLPCWLVWLATANTKTSEPEVVYIVRQHKLCPNKVSDNIFPGQPFHLELVRDELENSFKNTKSWVDFTLDLFGGVCLISWVCDILIFFSTLIIISRFSSVCCQLSSIARFWNNSTYNFLPSISLIN
jgi:hypothetical protein